MYDRCWCFCHGHDRADYNDALLNRTWFEATQLAHAPFVNIPRPVPADDPLEAAVASGCHCINRHTLALSDLAPPFPYTPPTHWTPDADATGEGKEEQP